MRVLVFALALAATAACAFQITGYTEQPKTLSKATMDRTSVEIHWVKDVDALFEHCTQTPGIVIVACARREWWTCQVWAVQPDDFNDVAKLAILGHEIWHCLGAQHDPH